jgi:hypothetical protein
LAPATAAVFTSSLACSTIASSTSFRHFARRDTAHFINKA